MPKVIYTILLYAVSSLIGLGAHSYAVLWILFLPVATAAVVTTFDMLLSIFDFDEIKDLKDTNKYLYILAVSILSAGFAIAVAIFLK